MVVYRTFIVPLRTGLSLSVDRSPGQPGDMEGGGPRELMLEQSRVHREFGVNIISGM